MKQFFPDFSILHKLLSAFTQIGFKLALFQKFCDWNFDVILIFFLVGPADDSDNFSHELRGVIPRGFEYLFSLINRQQEKVSSHMFAKYSFHDFYFAIK